MGITDMAVLGAIERIPRDYFVPDTLKDQAWEDTALPIDCGQTISQPYIVALMTQALSLSSLDKVLEIGTGCGYQTAILSKLSRRVYTIERHRALSLQSEERFKDLSLHNITAIIGDGMKGWPVIHGIEQAPFDKIIVTAAARHDVPQLLKDQLKIGGVLIAPVSLGADQVLRQYRKETVDTFSVKDLAPVRFVPLLPDIAQNGEAA